MPSPLSLDLRERIVAAYESRIGTMEYVAKLFSVGVATIHRLMAKKRKENSLAPKPHGGGNPARLSENDLNQLKELMEQQPDYTLEDLTEALSARLNKTLNVSLVFRGLQKIEYTRKKNFSRHGTRFRRSPTKASCF